MFTTYQIAKAVGANLIGSHRIMCNGVFTDTRKPRPGGLFIGLKGDNYNGGDFWSSAEASAAALLLDSPRPTKKPQIIVDDTNQALLDLAKYYRDSFSIPVVAVTGSVGKTTTKEFIAHVLSEKYITHKNQGNFNNTVGMPLTLLAMDKHCEACVVEMGMSGLSEISAMSLTARPTAAIITNIGVSHIEHLGCVENILKAKLEILEGMTEDGILLLNGDDPMLAQLELPITTYTFGIHNKDCTLTADNVTPFGFSCQGVEVRLPVIGAHNVLNALAALLIGQLHGIPIERAAKALSNYQSDGIRQSLVKTKRGISIIKDYYNASPQSVRSAIGALMALEGNRKILILGDMLELGDISEEQHSLIGQYTAEVGIDCLLTFGDRAALSAQSAQECGIELACAFSDRKVLSQFLGDVVKEGDCILIKGSRGMKMEQIDLEVLM